jgi:tetratricopeptide (TPR) repeat protein
MEERMKNIKNRNTPKETRLFLLIAVWNAIFVFFFLVAYSSSARGQFRSPNELIDKAKAFLGNSDYAEVLRSLDRIELTSASRNQLLQIMAIDYELWKRLNPNTSEWIECAHLLIAIDDCLPRPNALVLSQKGAVLSSMNNYSDAIKCYDTLLNLSLDATPEAKEHRNMAGKSLSDMGARADNFGKHDTACFIADTIISWFDKFKDSASQMIVAYAVVNKGRGLHKMGRLNASLSCNNLAIQRWGTSNQQNLVHPVTLAFLNKAETLDSLKRYREEIDCYDSAIIKANKSSIAALKPVLEPLLADAYTSKAVILFYRFKRVKDAIALCELVSNRFAGSTDPEVQTWLAIAAGLRESPNLGTNRHITHLDLHDTTNLSWIPVGSGIPSNAILNSLAYSSGDLYVASLTLGLGRLADGLNSGLEGWKFISIDSSGTSGMGPSDVVEANGTVIAARSGTYAISSTDHGVSWFSPAVTPSVLKDFLSIVAYNGLVFGLNISGNQIWISENHGLSWSRRTDLPDPYPESGSHLLLDRRRLYASTYYGKIYCSDDSAISWRALGMLPASTFVKLWGSSGSLWAGSDSGLYSSRDGAVWTKVSGIDGNIFSIATSDSEIYCGTNKGIWLSIDNGVSWHAVDREQSFQEVHSMIIHDGMLVVGTDQGIWKYHMRRNRDKTQIH